MSKRWPYDGPPPVPPEKRCSKCGRGAADGASFGRDARRKDGLKCRCKDCVRDVASDRWHNDPEYKARLQKSHAQWAKANPEKIREIQRRNRAENGDKVRERERRYRQARREHFRAKQRAWWHRNKEKLNAQKRAKRKSNPEPFRRWRRAEYWRNPEAGRQRSRDYRRLNREKVLARKRDYYRRNRDRINAGMRQTRLEKGESVRHRDRVYYWRNADRKRAIKRRSHERWGMSSTRKPSVRSLDDASIGSGGEQGRSLLERTASLTAPDPQEVVLTQQGQASALVWAETALSRDELGVLTAYADSGFNAGAASEMIGMGLADFERLLTRVQRRAREEIEE